MGSSLRRKGCEFKKDMNLAIISIGPLKIDHRIFESVDRNWGERPLKRTLKINTKNKMQKKIERQHKQENPFRSRDPDQGPRCISFFSDFTDGRRWNFLLCSYLLVPCFKQDVQILTTVSLTRFLKVTSSVSWNTSCQSHFHFQNSGYAQTIFILFKNNTRMFHFLNGAKWVGIFHKNKAAKVFKIISTTFKNTRPLICMSTENESA